VNIIQVKFRKSDDDNIKYHEAEVRLDDTVGYFRPSAEYALGLAEEHGRYQIVLEEKRKILKDGLTFREAGIKQDDMLIFVPPLKIQYSLILKIAEGQAQPNPIDPPINFDLEESDEDNPDKFFLKGNGQKRKEFEEELRKRVPREIPSFEIDKILQDWCEDIALGYRNTEVELKI
jgi:hypothetical protein